MWHRVCQVNEERMGTIFLNEFEGLARVPLRQCALVRRIFDHLSIPHQWNTVSRLFVEWSFGDHLTRLRFAQNDVLDQLGGGINGHVVAVRDSEVVVEPLLRGEEFWFVTQVPFADAGRAIAATLKHFRNRNFVGVQPNLVPSHQMKAAKARFRAWSNC